MGSISRCDYEAAKLRWENEEVALNPLVGNIINPPDEMLKQTWNNSNFKPGDNSTLESIVHQPNFNTIFPQHDQLKYSTKFMSKNPFDMGIEQNNGVNEVIKVSSMLPVSSGAEWRDENMQHDMIKQYNMNEVKVKLNPISSGGKYGEDSSPGLVKKRVIREKYFRRKSLYDEGASERSGCACQSDTFCRDHQTDFSDSGEECRSKRESFRSHSSARSSRHNQSERRRRDRINEKIKALQKLVPNASKTDKASMLDEVIEYLKQLKSQVRMMSNARSIMPQMMMPLAMQQQLQMSYLARMSMGIGMVDINNLARNLHNTFYPFASPLGGTAPSFLSPPFAMPPVVPPVKAPANAFVPNFNDAYKTLLAQQSMNMDFFNKVAALNSRPINHQINQSASQSQPNGQRK